MAAARWHIRQCHPGAGHRDGRRARRGHTPLRAVAAPSLWPVGGPSAGWPNALTPGDFPISQEDKTVRANGGAEAVENAVKMACSLTGRAGVIVSEGGYHGRTNLTMSMTSKYRLPVPNPYSSPQGMTAEEWVNWCCWNLDNALIAQIDLLALACIVIEPVQGEGGFVLIPDKLLCKMREVCDVSGAVMIADEIQSGSGCTGTLWATGRSGVVPDLLISAKSLGAGTPISAVTGRADLMDAPHLGGVGSTYGGSPLGCAAALAVLDVLTELWFLAQAEVVERVIREVWEPLRGELPIGDIRGVGAMMAVEVVKVPLTKEPWPEVVAAAVPLAVGRGVLVMWAGLSSNCRRFLPALNIPEDTLREVMQAVASAGRGAYAGVRKLSPA